TLAAHVAFDDPGKIAPGRLLWIRLERHALDGRREAEDALLPHEAGGRDARSGPIGEGDQEVVVPRHPESGERAGDARIARRADHALGFLTVAPDCDTALRHTPGEHEV